MYIGQWGGLLCSSLVSSSEYFDSFLGEFLVHFLVAHSNNNRAVHFSLSVVRVCHVPGATDKLQVSVTIFQFSSEVVHSSGGVWVLFQADSMDSEFLPCFLFVNVEGSGVGLLYCLGNNCLVEVKVLS